MFSAPTRYRWVVERTFAWLHQFKRLLVRYDRRAEIHEAFLALGCCAASSRPATAEEIARGIRSRAQPVRHLLASNERFSAIQGFPERSARAKLYTLTGEP